MAARLDLSSLLVILLCLTILPGALGEQPPVEIPATKPAGLDDWWADLAKSEPYASHALLQFLDEPEATVKFLSTRLTPLIITPEEVKELVADLGSGDEEVWNRAFEKLDYLDPRLAIDLETLMGEVRATPARQRLVAVLSGRPPDTFADKNVELSSTGPDSFNFRSEQGSWWAEHRIDRLRSGGYGNPKAKWTRADRAIVLLEHIGTPEAWEIIQRMATGHPEAEPTAVARGALEARPRR